MKLPRFSLRTLFVLVAIAAVPMGWVAYQLNWIRQRHAFIDRYQYKAILHDEIIVEPDSPWSLRIFGEQPRYFLDVPSEQIENGKSLFPEARISQEPAQ